MKEIAGAQMNTEREKSLLFIFSLRFMDWAEKTAYASLAIFIKINKIKLSIALYGKLNVSHPA